MLAVDRLREKAREYHLKALAYADMPDDEARRAAPVFAGVALALEEVAYALEVELEEAA